MAPLALELATLSDVGRRRGNEDAVFGTSRLLAVADGVGGAIAGEVASRVVIDALASLDKRFLDGSLDDELRAAVREANDTLAFVAACRPALAGMASTLVAVALGDDRRYLVLGVGDSRAYLYRGEKLLQLTRDDSLVQALIESGALTIEEARVHPQRSVVLAALDGTPRSEPRLGAVPAALGDRLLLCSDGLTDYVSDSVIARILGSCERSVAVERLVELALDAGSRDNVSVVVADVAPRTDPAGSWGRFGT
jgi:PPM family protein phosphatase